jgi:hypothetical protein
VYRGIDRQTDSCMGEQIDTGMKKWKGEYRMEVH